ncbi:hypothetical protein ACIBG7_20155 [Nonomuraea sp. NPDC050328]|uniref:hypothetical protein n=1 Tax=Nonomuraea sp. NPDC050328 TaxID=3364361 RepID=UPI003796592B
MTVSGTVYLLHFDRPYRHARHYIGWTAGDLERRLQQHRSGKGARLLEVITAAGISFAVARIWDGGRNLERSLKRRGGASRCCPLCGVTPRVTGWPSTDPALTPDPIMYVAAVCGCNRIARYSAFLLTSAHITCAQCRQRLVPLISEDRGGRHD